jgi:hypothetical protein
MTTTKGGGFKVYNKQTSSYTSEQINLTRKYNLGNNGSRYCQDGYWNTLWLIARLI